MDERWVEAEVAEDGGGEGEVGSEGDRFEGCLKKRHCGGCGLGRVVGAARAGSFGCVVGIDLDGCGRSGRIGVPFKLGKVLGDVPIWRLRSVWDI